MPETIYAEKDHLQHTIYNSLNTYYLSVLLAAFSAVLIRLLISVSPANEFHALTPFYLSLQNSTEDNLH